MAARGRKIGALTVRISPSVWVQVGRLSRDAFAAIQEALEVQADVLGQERELPEAGELHAAGHVASYEVDSSRRIMTLTAVRDER
jgi:hypothetical protein